MSSDCTGDRLAVSGGARGVFELRWRPRGRKARRAPRRSHRRVRARRPRSRISRCRSGVARSRAQPRRARWRAGAISSPSSSFERALLASRGRARDRCAARHAAQSHLLHAERPARPAQGNRLVPARSPTRRSTSCASASRTRASRLRQPHLRARDSRGRSARSARARSGGVRAHRARAPAEARRHRGVPRLAQGHEDRRHRAGRASRCSKRTCASTNRLFRNGKTTQDQVLRARAELLAVVQQLREARNGQSQARSYLNFLRNRPLDDGADCRRPSTREVARTVARSRRAARPPRSTIARSWNSSIAPRGPPNPACSSRAPI